MTLSELSFRSEKIKIPAYSYRVCNASNSDYLDPALVDIPLTRVKPLIKMLMAEGNQVAAILLGTHIEIKDLANLDKNISFFQYKKLVQNTRVLSNNPAFALHLGEQSFFNHDSLLGSRIVSCRNVKESMILLARYQPLFTQILAIEFEINQQGGVLNLKPQFPLGHTLPFFIEYTCAMIYSLGRYSLGGTPMDASIELSYSPPYGLNIYEDFFSLPIKFNCLSNRVLLSKRVLDQHSIFHDQGTAQQVDKVCVARVNELKSEHNVLERIRTLLKFQDLSSITLVRLAEKLCMSPRTLSRQLRLHDTSYTALLDNAKKQKSLVLVNKREVSIENLAEQLGYGDASSFSRAFKRWHGASPNTYRASNAK